MASKAIGFLNFKFGADLGGFERAMNKAQKRLNKFGKNIENTGRSMTMGFTLPIISMGAAALKFGSDLEETDSKFKQVFISVQEQAEDTAKVLQESFGLSELAAKQLLSDTGDLLVGFGFTEKAALELSSQVNKLAVDLASFSNFEGGAEGASKALTKALVGETESAKALQIVIRQNTKEYKERTAAIMKEQGVSILQAKAINNLEIATSQSTKAIGDFARTSGDFANQLRILKGEIVDIASDMGSRLIPIAQVAIEKFKQLVKWFDGLSTATKDNIVKWGLILAAIGPVLIIIGKVAIGLGAVIGLFKSLAVFSMANPFGVLIAALAAVVGGLDMWIDSQTRALSQAEALEKVEKRTNEIIKVQEQRVKDLTTKLEQENLSLEDKEKLLNELKTISPEYYGTLDASKLSVEKLTLATRGYVTSLKAKAKIEATNALIIENEIKLEEERLKLATLKEKAKGMINPYPTYGVIEVVEENIDGMVKNISTYQTIVDDAFKEMGDSAASFNEELENLEKNTKKVVTGGGEIVKETKMYSEALETVSTNMLFMASSAEDQFKGMLTWTKELTLAQKLNNAGWLMFGDIVTSSLDSALDSQENFFNLFLKNIKRAIRSLLIQLAVMTVIQSLMGVPAAFTTANLSKNLATLMGVTGFAEGGLVTGPTTALIGEGVGTTASNPEVVAPLDKLKQYMGTGNQNIIVEGVLKGNDIYLSNKNTSINRLRTT